MGSIMLRMDLAVRTAWYLQLTWVMGDYVGDYLGSIQSSKVHQAEYGGGASSGETVVKFIICRNSQVQPNGKYKSSIGAGGLHGHC